MAFGEDVQAFLRGLPVPPQQRSCREREHCNDIELISFASFINFIEYVIVFGTKVYFGKILKCGVYAGT